MLHYLQNLIQALDFSSMGDAALRVAAIFLGVTIHETCHGLAALALGDPTAKSMHRLSLNPLRHIDPLGLVMMFVAGFGWAKPVPVNPNYFKKPKQGMALTALAGPVSNFLLALLMLLAARIFCDVAAYSEANQRILDFLLMVALLSIGLGLFNLLPIPPLDGSKVLFAVLPDGAYNQLMRSERYGMLLLFALVFFDVGSSAFSAAIEWVFELFCRIVGLEGRKNIG